MNFRHRFEPSHSVKFAFVEIQYKEKYLYSPKLSLFLCHTHMYSKTHLPAPGMIVSCVHTYSDLSLGDSIILRHIRFSSRPCRFRTIVNSLTGWGSTPITLNLSTQYQVQKVRPAWGGNTLSPAESFMNKRNSALAL